MQPHQMDCAETESFLGGAIPSEATDISCLGCSVDFRLPHDRAGALTAAYPRLKEADPSTCVADLCPEGGADGTADVHIDAYNV
ncbi:hypothetical protein ABZ883_29510 [Streptomyces sp. NPDC046977]|uniref:hypothetical protein n=1 Tax=Streptomyces sp. NPDC046977 TaxID=3154703 RepID=UPI0033E63A22